MAGKTILEFCIISADYFVNKEEKAVVRIFGRTKEGKRVIALDYGFNPYFFAIFDKDRIEAAADEARSMTAGERKSRPLKVSIVQRKLKGKLASALKIEVGKPSDIVGFSEEARQINGFKESVEDDIVFFKRYLIDKKLLPLTPVRVTGEEIYDFKSHSDIVIRTETIEQVSEDLFENLKVMSYDIETYNPGGYSKPETDPLLMISLVFSNGKEKVITWKESKGFHNYVECVKSEAELLRRFREIVREEKPDIIVGYNSDNFDLPYLIIRANKYGIELDIGSDDTSIKLSEKSVKINGISNIDLYHFVRNILGPTMRVENYTLNSVGQELVSESKKEDFDKNEIHKIWDENNEKLVELAEYNLQDSKLTMKIFNKVSYILFELARLVGLPIQDVSRMRYGQLVEEYLSRRALSFNEFIPKKPKNSRMWSKGYEGGYVHTPKEGVYDDIVIYDFKSLYPSIIVSYNISPTTISCGCCGKDGHEGPDLDGEKFYFCKKEKGFIPFYIEKLIERRNRIKEMLKNIDKEDNNYKILEARSYAVKTVANAMYGYLGFSKSRWYCMECAGSITGLGRKYIKWVMDEAEKSGFNVIYGDSLPYEREIFVKFENGDIKLIKIGELYDRYKNCNEISTLAYTEKGACFKKINKFIRHEYSGELLKILTSYGATVVTPQHSVYHYDNGIKLADAKALKIGDNLISLNNLNIKTSYHEGYVFDFCDIEENSQYKNELFLYRDNLKFSSELGDCPYCKRKCLLSQHVYRKHKNRRVELVKEHSETWVGHKNMRGGRIPRYWKLDVELAWLLGFYCAEGSISDIITKSGRKALLSFGGQNKEIIFRVKNIIDKRCDTNLKIIINFDKRINKNMFYYRLQNVPIVALFKDVFKAGKGSANKEVPYFIFNSEEKLRASFIQGYLDGDGNSSVEKRYKTYFPCFSTKSKRLAEGLSFLLKESSYGINRWNKKLDSVYWHYRKDKPGIQKLRLQSAKKGYENFCLAEIKRIERLMIKDYVYDIEVEDSHNFVDGEGLLLVHNTDSIMISMSGKNREESKKFASDINEKLPDAMKLDFQGYYPCGLFVSAKKRYALADEKKKIIIKGFEFVRRDWSHIAKETQNRILTALLIDRSEKLAFDIIREVIRKIKRHEISVEDVVIHTQLTRQVEHYESIGPHVAAVKKAMKKGYKFKPGEIVKYVVSEGEGSISDKSYLLSEFKDKKLKYDSEYYINNQVVAAVDKIFEVLGYSKDDLKGKFQTTLGGFFG